MAYADTPEKMAEFIQGLRNFADFLEDTPEFKGDFLSTTVSVYTWGEEDFKHQVKALGGKREKVFTDYSLNVSRDLGGLTVCVNTDRNRVCTKKVVGTKMVEKTVPVSDETKVVEVEEDVYEYDCAVILE